MINGDEDNREHEHDDDDADEDANSAAIAAEVATFPLVHDGGFHRYVTVVAEYSCYCQ